MSLFFCMLFSIIDLKSKGFPPFSLQFLNVYNVYRSLLWLLCNMINEINGPVLVRLFQLRSLVGACVSPSLSCNNSRLCSSSAPSFPVVVPVVRTVRPLPVFIPLKSLLVFFCSWKTKIYLRDICSMWIMRKY